MSNAFIASAVALSVLGQAPVLAALPLQPNAKWNVDFGDAHCIASRTYGPSDKSVMLALKPSPIGEIMQVTVVRPSQEREVGQYRGLLTVDQAQPVAVSLLGFSGKLRGQRLTSINLPPAVYASLRQSRAFRVASSGEIDQTLAVSDMAAVAGALDRCVKDLQRVWHIGEASNVVAREAKPKKSLRNYFGPDDYPRVALNGAASGRVEMMMLIDEAGKIANCMVIATSGYASLDAQSCAVLTARAVFAPARGRDGKPIKSGFTQTIAWRLG